VTLVSLSASTRNKTVAAPMFSVIIPCFRARETVATAVISVLAQTESNFELILIDDGSPDDTAAVAIATANGDPRVRLIRQPNRGPAAARNRGVAAGSGLFLAFLDSDDRWAPDFLARHRDHFAARPNLGVSFARIRFFDSRMARPGRVSAHVPSLSLVNALGENAVCTTSNLSARREVWKQIGEFDTTMSHAEDQEWVVRVLAGSDWQVGGIDAELVDYRMSVSGLSADIDRMAAGWRTMIECARILAPGAVADAEAPARALFERYLARRVLRTGQNPARALAHLRTAFAHSAWTLFRQAPKRTLLTLAGAVGAVLLPFRPFRSIISR
jgi:glycosyltransferase involved in cell wall biosynthesis